MTFLEEFDGYYNVFEWELSEKMQIYWPALMVGFRMGDTSNTNRGTFAICNLSA
jgi:hypothetical protein